MRLQETGVGCHMGHRFSGALVYADNLTLLSPIRSFLVALVGECERYAAEFEIMFNGSKSKLLYFKGRYCSATQKGIQVNGECVNISKRAVHLDHTMYCIVKY